MQYNLILENIYSCDTDVSIIPIDLSELNIAKFTESFLINIFNYLWFFDMMFFFRLPNLFFFKDTNSMFIYKNRKLNDNYNIVDVNGFSFDLLFLLFCVFIFFFYIFCLSFYCKLNNVIRWSVSGDNLIIIKLMIFNCFFIIQNFLKNVSITSWIWNILDESTMGNGYPGMNPTFGLNRIDKILFYSDPLYNYDNIWKICQYSIVPLDVNREVSFSRNWSFLSIRYSFLNMFIVLFSYIFPFYSSYKLLYFSLYFKFFIVIYFFIYCLRWNTVYINQEYNLTMNFLFYIKNFYNNKLIKFNNYLNKLWF